MIKATLPPELERYVLLSPWEQLEQEERRRERARLEFGRLKRQRLCAPTDYAS